MWFMFRVLLFFVCSVFFLCESVAQPTSRDSVARPASRDPKAQQRSLGQPRFKPRKKDKKKPKQNPNRLEIGGIPAVNYNTDTGLGLGAIGSLTQFDPEKYPYRWRLFGQIYLTLMFEPTGVEVPYHWHYLELDLPQIFPNVRLYGRIQFIRSSVAGYYGLGNNAEKLTPWENLDPETQRDAFRTARRYQQYDRIYPGFSLAARITLWKKNRKRVEWYVRSDLNYNLINVYTGSKLARDIESTSGSTAQGVTLRDVLKGTNNHMLWLLSTGILWDTRNNEFTPYRGFLHELSVRASPGVDDQLYYWGATLNLRFYQSLLGEYLVLAGRLIGDIMVGNVPFYMLAEHGGYFPDVSLGGGSGVRAVPTGRYHGKFKVLGNLELRSKFLNFCSVWNLGALLFLDIGRAWLGAGTDTQLFDGQDSLENWLGLKASIGAGLRLQWGTAFVIRADIGYSNIGEMGFYLNVNHIF